MQNFPNSKKLLTVPQNLFSSNHSVNWVHWFRLYNGGWNEKPRVLTSDSRSHLIKVFENESEWEIYKTIIWYSSWRRQKKLDPSILSSRISQMVLVVKNPLANTGDTRDMSLFPGSGRSPEEGNDSPLQYSYLGNLMDRWFWQAAVHGDTKGVRTHTHTLSPFSITEESINTGLWEPTHSNLGEQKKERTVTGAVTLVPLQACCHYFSDNVRNDEINVWCPCSLWAVDADDDLRLSEK